MLKLLVSFHPTHALLQIKEIGGCKQFTYLLHCYKVRPFIYINFVFVISVNNHNSHGFTKSNAYFDLLVVYKVIYYSMSFTLILRIIHTQEII